MSTSDVRRILVALDASPHSEAALKAAAEWAELLRAELNGIFVLDAELLRMAALPGARETGLTSATRRVLKPRDMERALEVQASRARAALEETAERHRLRSSFRLTRGNVVTELLAASAGADLVALGIAGHMSVTGRRLGSTARGVTAGATCSVLLLSPNLRARGSVVVVYGSSPGAERALEQGIELGRQREAELVIALCGADDELAELREHVRQIVAREPTRARYAEIRPDRVDDLRAVVEHHACGLLVMPRDSALIEGRDDLPAKAGCALLLTR